MKPPSRSYFLKFDQALQIVRKRLDHIYLPKGLDVRHVWVLMACDEAECSQKAAAQFLRINCNVMVRIVDDMERKHLIKRIRNPRTRREYILELTPKGKEILKWVYDHYEDNALEAYRPLSKEELAECMKSCEKIISSDGNK